MKKFLLKILFLGCLLGMLGYGEAYADPGVTITAPTNTNYIAGAGGTYTITATITRGVFIVPISLTSVSLTGPNSSTPVAFTQTGSFATSVTITSAFISVPTTPGTYTYTVTATDALNGSFTGPTSKTITITVLAAPPTVTGTTILCGSGTTSLTAAGSPTGGTYKWWTASTGGTQLATTATYTPYVLATTTYYAEYTNVTTSTRTPVTVTVNPILSQLPAQPVESYPFAGNADDDIGVNDGILKGTTLPTLTADRFGNTASAYSFAGTNASPGYITTTTQIAAPATFTVSLWFKTVAGYAQGGNLIGFGTTQLAPSTPTFDRNIYMTSTGTLIFGTYQTAYHEVTTVNSYNDGLWHHVTATFGTGGTFLYVDDAETISNVTTAYKTAGAYNGYWHIGGDNLTGRTTRPPSDYFAGTIDDIQIFNSALSATQIDNLSGATTNSPVCVGSTVTLSANTVTGATYTWTGPNGFTSSLQTPSIASVTAAAAGNYIVTATTPSGCNSQAMATVLINNPPATSFTTSATTVNINANVTVTNTSTGGTSYAWNFGTDATPATSTSATTATVKWSTPGLKTITLTATNAAGCTATTTQNVVVGAGLGTYAFTMPLTLNTVSMALGGNLTNFPYLVSITDSSLKATANCATSAIQFPNGPSYDFAFYDPVAGAQAPYQVVKYDPVAGTLLAWVKIASLSHTTNNSLSFLYGSATANTTNNPASVWAADYLAVYHFDEGATSGANTILDATSNLRNATPTATAATTGQVGGAYTFNGTSTVITGPTTASITGPFTLSAWVKPAAFNAVAFGNSDQKIVTNESGIFTGATDGYKMGLTGGSTTTVKVEMETAKASTIDLNRTATGGLSLATGTWYYIQAVYTGSSFLTYRNGVLDRTYTTAVQAPGTSNAPIIIGEEYSGHNPANGDLFLNGVLDEVRISNLAKSADWIKAEYLNQNTPASYTTKGAITANASASAIKGAVQYTWTGAASADPADASNWSTSTQTINGNLPPFDGSATLDIANAGTPPALTVDISLYGLIIETGASLNLNGHNLTVGCNIYNNITTGGQIIYGGNTASGITWNGTAAQSYNGINTAGTASTGNMTINNAAGVTIQGGPFDIYNVLKLSSGSLTINTTANGALTLKSTSATSTASVDKITTGSIIGNVNVERFMTGGAYGYRGYRLLSSPVFTGQTIGHNSYDVLALQKTTPITGGGATGTYALAPPSSNFDPSVTGYPSVLYYYEPNPDPKDKTIPHSEYKGLATIGTPFFVGNGFMFFFRGNRNVNDAGGISKVTTAATPESTVLNFTGTLNQGNIDVYLPTDVINPATNSGVYATPTAANTAMSYTTSSPASTRDGFHLVGNPYASAIDLDQVAISSPYSTPNYIYMLNNSGTFGAYQQGSSGSGGFNNGVGRFVLSGQGFFVRGNASGTTTVSFAEANKVSNATASAQAPQSFAAQPESRPAQQLNITLALDSLNANETVIQFGKAKNKFDDHEDAYYIYGLTQTTFMSSYSTDNQPCLWNVMGSLDSIKTIPLYAEGQTSGRYTMTFKGDSTIDSRYKLFLKDNLLKDSLDLTGNTKYEFNIDRGNTNTYGDKRFSLVVYASHIQDLYQLTTFNAIKYNNSIQLNWKADHEGTYTDFKVQRSIDGGKTFTTIGDVQSDGSGVYGFADTNPMLSGTNQYRIFQTVDSTVTKTSSVVTVTYTPEVVAANVFKVYPNPASTTLNVTANIADNGGPVVIRIYNMKSQLILSHNFSKGSTLSMDVSQLIQGAYVVHVTDNNKDYGSAIFTKL